MLTGSLTRDGDVVELRLDGALRHVLTFRVPEHLAVATDGAPALAALLLPAMVLGEDLELTGPVPDRLLRQAETVQDIFVTWDRALRPGRPKFHRVKVTAPARAEPRTAAPSGTASFFTGGVDSFHTALRHRDDLDALVYVHGFDVPLTETDLRSRVSARLHEAAGALGVPLLEVESDLRPWGEDLGLGWLELHGAGLAAVALLLAPRFSTIFLPATNTYAELQALGSHPLLDPLWSTDELEIVHDGAADTRLDKLAALAEHDAPRRHLRVCFENNGGAYNCGRCEKCLRTGIGTRILGLSDRFTSLPPLSLTAVARTGGIGAGTFWRMHRAELRRRGGDPALRLAMDVALVRWRLGRLPGMRRIVRS